MVVRQEKPFNETGRAAPRGRLTWIALAGVALFVILLVMMVLRPVVDRNDGPETAPPTVLPAAEGATPPPGPRP